MKFCLVAILGFAGQLAHADCPAKSPEPTITGKNAEMIYALLQKAYPQYSRTDYPGMVAAIVTPTMACGFVTGSARSPQESDHVECRLN